MSSFSGSLVTKRRAEQSPFHPKTHTFPSTHAMMLTAKPAQFHRRLAGPSPTRPLTPARCVVVRFKESQQEDPNDLLARRKAEEEVIRRQEQSMHEGTGLAEDLKSSLRHAASKPDVDAQIKVSWLQPAFTRRREIFAGRIAMVGFTAACFWEWYFPGRPNILEQVAGLGQWAGLPVEPSHVALLFGGIVLHNAVFALAPWSPTWSVENLRDVSKRPVGPPSTLVNPLNIKRFFGASDWGFTKANELLHGRLAMLGFAAALVQQLRLGGYTGPGALAQVAMYLGVPPDDTFYGAIPAAFCGWALFATVLAYLLGRPGTMQGESDIY